jgi:1-aminocyclopropane-1-carboxylate deaminase/D-cysteine desulfhydrase-like pyridoxal-dependent ACC family enzyme
LDQLFGAEIVTIADRALRDQTLRATYDKAGSDGRKPYLVTYGGSSPTGALGYAYAMQEFMEQNVHADWIVFGTSSGGTHAGLVLGQRVFGYQGRVLGISIDEPEEWLKTRVSALASDASEKMGERIDFTRQDVLANEEYCKSGYGVLTDAEREAVKLFAKYEGLLLDPVYTGRAAAGMIDLIRGGFFKKDETILFWHTGGQPALFAEKYANKI